MLVQAHFFPSLLTETRYEWAGGQSGEWGEHVERLQGRSVQLGRTRTHLRSLVEVAGEDRQLKTGPLRDDAACDNKTTSTTSDPSQHFSAIERYDVCGPPHPPPSLAS